VSDLPHQTNMQIFKLAQAIENFTLKQRANHLKIGFIPTMGALHAGHLSLISASKRENDLTIASVFVNPTQFNEPADYQKYPRQVENDLRILEEAGCDVAFTPSVKEIYPVPDTHIYNLGAIAEKIEGAQRPGHFNGVASVVKRLLELVNPHNAYFGLKDYQQYLIIKKLTDIYKLEVNIVGCPILREESGLAMSSRNQLLSENGKVVASDLHRSLQLVKKAASQYAPADLEKIGITYLNGKEGISLEYFVVVDKNTLSPIKRTDRSELIALLAARVDGVRLIDNMLLG